MGKIRFCGNCNPDVHPRMVKEALEQETVGDDVEVIVDGCTRACLSKKNVRAENAPKVVVMSAKEIVRRHR